MLLWRLEIEGTQRRISNLACDESEQLKGGEEQHAQAAGGRVVSVSLCRNPDQPCPGGKGKERQQWWGACVRVRLSELGICYSVSVLPSFARGQKKRSCVDLLLLVAR